MIGRTLSHYKVLEEIDRVPRNEGIKEILDRLDRYLGPVS